MKQCETLFLFLSHLPWTPINMSACQPPSVLVPGPLLAWVPPPDPPPLSLSWSLSRQELEVQTVWTAALLSVKQPLTPRTPIFFQTCHRPLWSSECYSKSYKINNGVPQGPVSGPTLISIIYKELLKSTVSPSVSPRPAAAFQLCSASSSQSV